MKFHNFTRRMMTATISREAKMGIHSNTIWLFWELRRWWELTDLEEKFEPEICFYAKVCYNTTTEHITQTFELTWNHQEDKGTENRHMTANYNSAFKNGLLGYWWTNTDTIIQFETATGFCKSKRVTNFMKMTQRPLTSELPTDTHSLKANADILQKKLIWECWERNTMVISFR